MPSYAKFRMPTCKLITGKEKLKSLMIGLDQPSSFSILLVHPPRHMASLNLNLIGIMLGGHSR